MATGEFEKDSLGWQLHQLQSRFSQWWEWQLGQFNPNLPDFNPSSWSGWSWVWELTKGVMICLLIALIIWAIWRIWRLISPYFANLKEQVTDLSQKLVQRELSVGEWLARSQKFQQKGDYYQACRCIYLAMLQRLHDTSIVPHQSSRTDGEYLYLILQLPQPEPLETLLNIHQQLCFGRIEPSSSLLATCQQAYQEISL